jgi:SMODS and SLOG-associating 2TM effector domain 2
VNQPDEPQPDVTTDPRAEPARDHGDLLGRPFPRGDWGDPSQRLDELYVWVESRALHTADWYLRDRRWKKRTAQTLRCVAAAAATAAAALPVLELTDAVAGAARWGFLAALVGVACLAADRCFGLTAGWIRDVATAQAAQRRLEALQFDWASETLREVLGPADGTASEAAERCLAVLRRFTEDVTELVRAETADWMVAFRVGSAPLMTQSLAWVRWPDPGHPPRFPFPPPGLRPNMPRQRPPER